jgi:Fe2+ or Zn2+ uptake regulation protein
MIKADFWSDEKVGSVSLLSRLLFIGSWTIADDSGVCRAHSIFLKNQLFPYDEKVTRKNIEDSLSELANAGLVSFIDYQGESYIYISNFGKHQLINRPSEHRFIDIEADDYSKLIEQSVSNHGALNGKVKVKVKVNVKENINHACAQCLKTWNERIGEFKVSRAGL